MTIVDEAGGITLSGSILADKFREKWGGSYDTAECEEALRHWVEAAGYDENGVLTVVYSNYRL